MDRAAQSDPCTGGRACATVLRRLHRDVRGAAATEYMLIIALVILPIALLWPMFLQMIRTYAARLTAPITWPFP